MRGGGPRGGKGTREEGKDRMKEPQSFRFRAAAAVASRAWPMEEGLPPSFHPSHLLRYPLARPPASSSPLSRARVRPHSLLRPAASARPLGSESGGSSAGAARDDGEGRRQTPSSLLQSSSSPSFHGRRQRPTKGRLCRRLPEQQHRSRPAGQRRQAGASEGDGRGRRQGQRWRSG